MSSEKNNTLETILSQNIRFLRRKSGLSQEELANILGVKRSSIAAYERKNVEPRLRVVLEVARYFDVNVQDLLQIRLDDSTSYRNFDTTDVADTEISPDKLHQSHALEFDRFAEQTVKIRKVLEGFRAFYTFKREQMNGVSPENHSLRFDIDNFIQLTDHLLSYNESVLKLIGRSK